MSTNAMNFGPAWMRGDAARQARGEAEGRSSPNVQSNGSSLGPNTSFPQTDSSLHIPGVNGTSSTSTPHGRASSFSYSSILASTPAAQSPGGDGHGGNGATANHDKPFKYTKDEMLNIWKSNAAKFKSSGIPLEFEKHEAFTSEEPLDPALLTEMTPAEREAFSGPFNSDKPDPAAQGRLDRGGRQFSPKTERFQPGLMGSSGRSGAAPRNRTSSRGESGSAPYTTGRPQPRSVKSRDYFTGAFGGSSAFSSGNSPPEKDIWGSATKKGSFDENGKFIVAEDDKDAQPLEEEDKLDEPEQLEGSSDLADVPPQAFTQGETFESPTQASDSFSALPAVGGRATSRFSSFAIPAEDTQPQQDNESRPIEPLNPLSGPAYADDHEDDVLNDILAMASDPSRAMSPPRQMDRLTSRFAQQSLTPEPTPYGAFGGMGPFDADSMRRDSASMSQFFPAPQRDPKTGLFEHPVISPQPALPPAPPQTTRVMIMADKLKWVYKDPHGNVQGPFTGLEMHEWYRGGYFHATLEVKREDDMHFEPLQALVKRIGNQREPFLVPLPSKTQTQVIPPRSTTTLSGWNTTLFGEGVEEPKPWVAPVPTIAAAALTGTTLTADQQNALERRKQEEQYMLVRQRELVTQQALSHSPVHPLHHSSPQHFGPSPAAYGGFSPMLPLPMGITHHVHTPAPVQVQTLPALDTLRTGGSIPQVPSPAPVQPMESPMQRRHDLGFQGQPMQQPNRGFMSPWGPGPLGPLSPGMVPMDQMRNQDAFLPQQHFTEEPALDEFPQERKMSIPAEPPAETEETPAVELSAPEVVDQSRKSSVSVASPKPAVASPVPEPEPVPVEEEEITEEPETIYETTSPNLPEESQDASTASPAVAPSPARVAPWATPQKKPDPQKSLSLKQIQEIEAKKAAEQAKRLAAERQIILQQQAAVAAAAQPPPQQGLPQGSTWGSVAAKGWTAKPVTPTPSPGKKTMAQIQKEEEEAAERNKAGKKEVTNLAPSGKGYAGVAATAGAAKPAMPTAWTMVGPGGRPQPGRPINSGGINPNIPPTTPIRAAPVRTVLETKPVPPVKASPQPVSDKVEEFQRWCRTQLRSLSGVNYDEIYNMLISLPPNENASQEIISDTIYAHSSTLDGRHFAEEFLKRRKALGPALDVTTAPVTPGSSSGSGGWNEVLKKEKAKDAGEWNSAFKVVAGKKGRRRG